MFTKEIDNIARALPSFCDLMANLRNPLSSENTSNDLPLETVAKSIWMVIPFHFGAFFGLSTLDQYEATTVVLVGLISLVTLMWLGVGLGYVPPWKDSAEDRAVLSFSQKAGLASRDAREKRSSQWVAGLIGSWFFAVLSLSLLNLAFLLQSRLEGHEFLWPDLREEVERLLNGGADLPLIALFAATFGTAVTGYILRRNGGDRSNSRDFVFLATCWTVTATLIAVCGVALSPPN